MNKRSERFEVNLNRKRNKMQHVQRSPEHARKYLSVLPDTWIIFSHIGWCITLTYLYPATYQPRLSKTRLIVASHGGSSTCSNPSSCLFVAPAGRIFAFDPLRHFLPILFSSLEELSFFFSFLSFFGFHASSLRQENGRDDDDICSLLWFHSDFIDWYINRF